MTLFVASAGISTSLSPSTRKPERWLAGWQAGLAGRPRPMGFSFGPVLWAGRVERWDVELGHHVIRTFIRAKRD